MINTHPMRILLTLLLVGTALSQFSYVPSRMFASYQASIFNYNNNNASITASNNSNPYTVPLSDIHNNVLYHALVLGGLSLDGATDCQFAVQVAGSTSTQYHLAVTVFAASSFSKMIFFLLLVGNQANGYIEAVSITQACNLVSTNTTGSGSVVESGSRFRNTTVTAPFSSYLWVHAFQIAQNLGGSFIKWDLQIVNTVGQELQYKYSVDAGNSLSSVSYVILFVSSEATIQGSVNPNVSLVLVGSTNNYSPFVNSIDSTASVTDGFKYGFDSKCLFSNSFFYYGLTDYIDFDSSTALPLTTFNISANQQDFMAFCMIELYDCSRLDANCMECLSHSTCLVCTAEYYPQSYPNNTAYCQLCSSAISGCFTCDNTSACLTCLSPTHLYDAGNCLLCAVYITSCLNCTDNSTCLSCVDFYGLVNSTTCDLCSNLMEGCQLCSSASTCTACYNGYYLSGSSCLKCNTGVENCAVCVNSTICLLCNSDSYLSSGNTTCVCNAGSIKVSGLCTMIGCASAYRFNSTTVCLACNTSMNFYYNTTDCVCSLGYQLSGTTCNLICGDGRKITEGCDDANVISGDGCSSTCQVQPNYACSGGSLYSKSTCVYVSDITLTLVQIKRVLDSNTAEIVFTLSPLIRSLTSMNFNQYVSLAVGTHNVSYTTTYAEDGTVTCLVDYSSNIEGQGAVFTLGWDPSMVGLSPTVMTFNMVGSNQPLIVSGEASLQNMILYLSYAVAALFILQMLLSMIFHKMIGLQTMQIAQIVFFVRYLLGNSGSMAVYNMYPLQYINGYNIFSAYDNVLHLDSVTMRMGLGKNFVFNVMIQVALIILFWLISFYFSKKVNDLKLRGAEQTSLGMEELKKVMVMEYKMATAAFILTVYSFYIFAFALLTSVQQNNEVKYDLPRLLLIFTLIIFFYGAMYITAQMYLSWLPKYDEDEGLRHKYVTVFLVYHILVILMIIGLYTRSYGLEIIAGAQAAYIVLLIVMKPYFLKPQNVLLIICLVVGLIFIAILILLQYLTIQDKYMSYVVIGYLGLLVLVSVLAFVRFYLHSKNNDKAWKLYHQEEDRLKGKDTFTKNQFKKHQEELKTKETTRPSLVKKRELARQKQKDELSMIKSRLKEEYANKGKDEQNIFLE